MLESFLFGMTLAIAIGPIALLILNLSMTAGLPAGLRSGVGAALGDLSYGLLAFLGARGVSSYIAKKAAFVHIGASALLALMGVYLLWNAVKSYGRPRLPAVIEGNPLFATYALTLSNPLTLVLFVGFFSGVASRAHGASPLLLALSLFLGSLSVQVLLALGGGLLARLVKDARALSCLNAASAVGIFGFGVYGFIR